MAREVAAEHMHQVHQSMKDIYDRSAKPLTREPGDIVYIDTPRLRLPATKLKLTPRGRGPFIILRFTSPSTVLLQRLSDSKIMSEPVNVSRLKRAKLRDLEIYTQPPAFAEKGNADPPPPV